MEKHRNIKQDQFAKKWKLSEFKVALIVAVCSVVFMGSAFSMSLINHVASPEFETIEVRVEQDNGWMGIDPRLRPNQSLLVTVQDSERMMGQSVRLSDTEIGQEKVSFPTVVWQGAQFLLTEYSDSITQSSCRVDPASITIDGFNLICDALQ